MRRRLLVPAVLVVATMAAVSCSDSSDDEVADPTVPATEQVTTLPDTTTTSTSKDRTCDPTDPDTCTLRQLADRAGILLGAAVARDPLADDPAYASVLGGEFNSVTPENAFKWPQTEPEAGVYTWGPADEIATFAAAHDQAVRGHTLVWPNSRSAQLYEILPAYVTDAPDAATMQQAVDDHIAAVVDRFGDVTDRWDVINEPLVTGGTEVDPNDLTRTLGEDWMVRAFEQTRELDPDARLFVNEVLTERPGPKHDALVALVGRLTARGAPVDGVGLQSHFLAGAPPREELEAVMRDWEAMGLDVAITELDIPTVENDEDAQAEQYADVVAACLAVDACVEVTLWGFTDRYTWLDDFLGPGSAPLLFDENDEPKPAYHAIAAVLADAAR